MHVCSQILERKRPIKQEAIEKPLKGKRALFFNMHTSTQIASLRRDGYPGVSRVVVVVVVVVVVEKTINFFIDESPPPPQLQIPTPTNLALRLQLLRLLRFDFDGRRPPRRSADDDGVATGGHTLPADDGADGKETVVGGFVPLVQRGVFGVGVVIVVVIVVVVVVLCLR